MFITRREHSPYSVTRRKHARYTYEGTENEYNLPYFSIYLPSFSSCRGRFLRRAHSVRCCHHRTHRQRLTFGDGPEGINARLNNGRFVTSVFYRTCISHLLIEIIRARVWTCWVVVVVVSAAVAYSDTTVRRQSSAGYEQQ